MTARFDHELSGRAADAEPATRAELLAVVHAVSTVRLAPVDDAGLMEAAGFVTALHPLRVRAPTRKSQVAHALAGSLATVLGALADAGGVDRTLTTSTTPGAAAWAAALATVWRDVGVWVARHPTKHARAGLPLLAACLACEGDAALAAGAPSLAAALGRGLKDRTLRSAALRGAARVAAALARAPHLPAPGETAPCRTTWLTSLASGAVAAARKAGSDCGPALAALAAALARESPPLALDVVVLDALAAAADGPAAADLAAVGATALLDVLAAAAAGTDAPLDGQPCDVSALVALTAAGGDALAVAGASDLAPRAQRALAAALAAVEAPLAPWRPPLPGARPPGDPLPRDRAPLAGLLAAVFNVIPFVLPAGWDAQRAALELPAWTLHADPRVAAAATHALLHCAAAAPPPARAAAVTACARLALRLPDTSPEAQCHAVALVGRIAGAWTRAVGDALVQGGATAAATHVPPLDAQADALLALDTAAMLLLCSGDAAARQAGVEAAVCARRVGAALDAARWVDTTSPPPPSPHRMADVIDGAGDALAARCAWDWTPWADGKAAAAAASTPSTWRPLLAAPPGGDASTSRARWTSEIGARAALLVPRLGDAAFDAAYRRLSVLLGRDGAPRVGGSADAARDAARGDLAASLAALAAALPPPGGDATRHRALFFTLVAHVRSAPDAALRSSVTALGFCSPAAHGALAAALRPTHDELSADKPRASRARGRARDELRAAVGHVWRCAAAAAPRGALARGGPLRLSLLDWAADALRWLAPAAADGATEVQAVRLCLAVIVRRVGGELGAADPATLPPAARQALFTALGAWCGDGATPAKLRADIARGAAAARARHPRDARAGSAAEEAALRLADAVERAALQAQAALLNGPPFDGDDSRPASTALAWADALLTRPAGGSARAHMRAARAGLRNALASQPRAAPAFVDAALGPDPVLAAAAAAALADVYRAVPLALPVATVATVALFGAGAPDPSARAVAARMLASLEARAWGATEALGDASGGDVSDDEDDDDTDDDAPPLPISSALSAAAAEAHEANQLALASRLAAAHPELAPALLTEATRRLLPLASARAAPRGALRALAPIVRSLDFGADGRVRGGGGRAALECLLALTAALGSAGAAEAEALWAAAAAAPGNAGAALGLLISAMLGGLPDTPRPPAGDAARAARWIVCAAPAEAVAALAAEVAGALGAPEPARDATDAALVDMDVLLGDDGGDGCAFDDAPPPATHAASRSLPPPPDDPRARCGAALWLLAPAATAAPSELAPRAPLVAHACLLAASRGEPGPIRGATAALDALAEASGVKSAVGVVAGLAAAGSPARLLATVAAFVNAVRPMLPPSPGPDGWAAVALRCALGCGCPREAAASHAALRALAPAAAASVTPALVAAAAAAETAGAHSAARAALASLSAYVARGAGAPRGLVAGLAAAAAGDGGVTDAGVALAAAALTSLDVADGAARLAVAAAAPPADASDSNSPTWSLGAALVAPSRPPAAAQWLLCAPLTRGDADRAVAAASAAATAAADAVALARTTPSLTGWTSALDVAACGSLRLDALGSGVDQVAGGVLCGLPWAAAASASGNDAHTTTAISFLHAHAEAAAALGLDDLAASLSALATAPRGRGRVRAVATAVAAALPAGRERDAVAAVTVALTSPRASTPHKDAALQLLAAVLRGGGGAPAAREGLAAAAAELGGPMNEAALDALQAAIEVGGAGGDDLVQEPAGCTAADALARVAAAWPVAVAGV